MAEELGAGYRWRLATARLDLDPVTLGDVAALHALFADRALHEFVPFDPPTFDELARRCERWSHPHRRSPSGDELWLNWIARARGEGGAAIAHFQLGSRSPAEVSLGWMVARSHQRRGLAREALGAVLAFAREGLGAAAAKAWVDTRNLASIRLAESLAMSRVGLIHGADSFKGEVSDEIVFEKKL